jgi:hypothetical protein
MRRGRVEFDARIISHSIYQLQDESYIPLD